MTTIRLLYLVSHPIQYQAPLLRRIAAEPGIALRVVFERDTAGGYFDEGFGRRVCWDVPLRDGYDSALASETQLAGEIAKADVVWLHGWQGHHMRQALALARKLGRPVLLRGENTDTAMPDGTGLRGFIKRRFLNWVFDRTTAFLTIGTDNRDYYLRRDIAAERLFPMPYAVDNAAFAAAAAAARPHRASFAAGLGLDPARKTVLWCGKLMARKRPDVLLDAWRRASWNDEAPQLVFVGDGELRDMLDNGPEPGLHFLGFRNQGDLPAFYDLADVFVLPAEREPWGLAVNEAMACGTAIIVSDQVGCARDLVSPACGAVVPAGDGAALAAALVDVVSRSEAAGQAASRRMADWDFEADVAGLRQALDSLRKPA